MAIVRYLPKKVKPPWRLLRSRSLVLWTASTTFAVERRTSGAAHSHRRLFVDAFVKAFVVDRRAIGFVFLLRSNDNWLPNHREMGFVLSEAELEFFDVALLSFDEVLLGRQLLNVLGALQVQFAIKCYLKVFSARSESGRGDKFPRCGSLVRGLMVSALLVNAFFEIANDVHPIVDAIVVHDVAFPSDVDAIVANFESGTGVIVVAVGPHVVEEFNVIGVFESFGWGVEFVDGGFCHREVGNWVVLRWGLSWVLH